MEKSGDFGRESRLTQSNLLIAIHQTGSDFFESPSIPYRRLGEKEKTSLQFSIYQIPILLFKNAVWDTEIDMLCHTIGPGIDK